MQGELVVLVSTVKTNHEMLLYRISNRNHRRVRALTAATYLPVYVQGSPVEFFRELILGVCESAHRQGDLTV